MRQALANVLAIVDAAGSEPDHILRVTAYVVGVENWGTFNSIFAEAFGNARPAPTVVPVTDLHHGYKIEIDAIAIRGR